MDEKKLKALTENFMKNVLGNESHKQKCFAVCYPLSFHLENNDFKNTIVLGQYKKGTHHTWLSLDADRNYTIDPTIKQFYPDNINEIHFGTKSDDYTIFPDDRFISAYNGWLTPFRNISAYDGEANFKATGVDLNVLLKIAVHAATIINKEYEYLGIDFNSSIKSRLYFCGICEILSRYKDRSELNQFSTLDGFHELASKTICR